MEKHFSKIGGFGRWDVTTSLVAKNYAFWCRRSPFWTHGDPFREHFQFLLIFVEKCTVDVIIRTKNVFRNFVFHFGSLVLTYLPTFFVISSQPDLSFFCVDVFFVKKGVRCLLEPQNKLRHDKSVPIYKFSLKNVPKL